MAKPIVAVVGRPNVGKSMLFNRLVGARVSIVHDSPGVTRDRIYADCDWLNYNFTLIDTGGIDAESDEIIPRQTLAQAELAIDTADVIIFVVDAKVGVTEQDAQVADILRKSKKPVVLTANKIDDMRRAADAFEFFELGLGEPIAVSAGQKLALGDLLDRVVAHFPKSDGTQVEDDTVRVAVVGKPNVGKSSLINYILGEERVIVSKIPGTTRDAIDTFYERNGKKYIFVDTAGLRRKNKVKDYIEKFSVLRTVTAVERCDVCVFMTSAEKNAAEDGFLTEQDAKAAGIAHDSGKASIVAVNKWDIVEKDDKTMKKFEKEIARELKFMPYAPTIFISALTGQRVAKLFDLIDTVWQNSALRVQTGFLNDVIIDSLAVTPPPAENGKQLRIYYVTQVAVKPPTFVFFVNNVELFHFSYKRHLENILREAFGFKGTPIRIIARNKNDS